MMIWWCTRTNINDQYIYIPNSYILNNGIDKIATYTENQKGNQVQNKESNKLHKQECHHQWFWFSNKFWQSKLAKIWFFFLGFSRVNLTNFWKGLPNFQYHKTWKKKTLATIACKMQVGSQSDWYQAREEGNFSLLKYQDWSLNHKYQNWLVSALTF
jgi:hypothetical protein